ncbi:FecR family protein [Flavivirga sp. 57AJ16]|uniref:FecR family protein n=1 Tax=Flavivirga sp. 57AJ16 TaxID=3025307 RepID=UPI0023662A4B|nr:FecR family protein [Flavivirga sp. 57AJ16]MDD7888023.1 DUF4974 domain-containing protein [Flavivirga sp. 57AJ16]
MKKGTESIIQKYLKNEISYEALQQGVDGISVDELRAEIKKSVEINYLLSKQHLQVNDSKETYLKILAKAKSKQEKEEKSKRFRLKPFYKYAALLVLFLGITYVIQLNFSKEPQQLIIEDASIILELGNGTAKQIDLKNTSKITNTEGAVIADQQEDKLVYTQSDKAEELIYNTLKIPFGKKFTLELSDGSLVTLNSGTTFRFPQNFLSEGERKVFIEGEAFFQVKEDKARPFIVSSSEVDVRVLGTKFNISTYPEDKYINTVLVSGSVSLIGKNKEIASLQYSQLLSPGEKAGWNSRANRFIVEKVDTDLYTTWVDGKLLFRGMTFKRIRIKLERHYNVKIVNENLSLDNMTFLASFDIESIEEVIETFKRNYGINYEIKDNKIIIN